MVERASAIPAGFLSVNPYLIVPGAGRLLEFLRAAFGAEEKFRAADADGGIRHAEAHVGDTIVEMADATAEWPPMTAGLHHYVPDADAVYRRAMEAGAVSLHAPVDQSYGDREAGIRDPGGNHWYIATHTSGSGYRPEGLRDVTSYLSVQEADRFLVFLRSAFACEVAETFRAPDGTIGHARLRIGDTTLELSEARGPWGPRAVALHHYVPDCDAVYRRALAAGARSLSQPQEQSYGERNAGVVDGWGNHWYIATRHAGPQTSKRTIAGPGQTF